MQALRWLKYLKPSGKIVVNDYQINWDKIIRDNVKPQFVEINLKAIGVGISLV